MAKVLLVVLFMAAALLICQNYTHDVQCVGICFGGLIFLALWFTAIGGLIPKELKDKE